MPIPLAIPALALLTTILGGKSELDARRKRKEAETVKADAMKKWNQATEAITSPLPDRFVPGRKQAAKQILSMSQGGPEYLAKSVLAPKPEPKKTYPLQFEGTNLEFDDPAKWLNAMIKVNGVKKDSDEQYNVTLDNGQQIVTDQKTFIDYVQNTGDFDPNRGISNEKVWVNVDGLQVPITGWQYIQYLKSLQEKYNLTNNDRDQVLQEMKANPKYGYDGFSFPQDFDFETAFDKEARKIHPDKFKQSELSKDPDRWKTAGLIKE